MGSADNGSTRLFTIVAGQIDAADDARRLVAESAFDRLHVANLELAQLAIQALHSRRSAARFFIRKFCLHRPPKLLRRASRWQAQPCRGQVG